MTTVAEFLQPSRRLRELDHILVKISDNVQEKHDSANTAENAQKHDADSSRYSPLAEMIEEWSEFDVQTISSDPSIAPCLSRSCEVRWEPQIPKLARVIYSERQLEALYLQTLITRVNIALDKAIPPEEDRIAIVVGPGAFESVSAEATAQWLLPDWIVVQGTFDTKADLPQAPQDLEKGRKILAVGDTKLVRQWGGKSAISHTRACYRNFLRQLQEYCVNLSTRFGFILSNEELVVAQFVGAQETSPRRADQRGLRSRTNGTQQLGLGLDDDASQRSESSQMPGYNEGYEDDPYELPNLSTSVAQVPSKRPHPSTSPETSPVAAATAAWGINRYQNRPGSNGSNGSHQMPSDPPVSVEEAAPALQASSQDHSKYTSSVRDVEVEAIRIRSFDMMGQSKDSPYMILFTFVMMIRALKLRGETLHIC